MVRPVYESFVKEGNRIIASFAHTGSGLVSGNGGDLKVLTIAAAAPQLVFVPAKAEVVDNKVVVYVDEVAEPAAVRYNRAKVPEGALSKKKKTTCYTFPNRCGFQKVASMLSVKLVYNYPMV
ncbi:hypothetical protein DB346_01505 [Verrucomicrobia bacterium LW23]|nr:hypothetical protein DB346_01505 [Verrucomicrobia bacterium LW23]